MKRFLIVIIFILILFVATVTVFVLTFDANRYKDVLITKLEKFTGKDVRIDNISLSFLHGLRVQAWGVAIKDKDKTWEDFLLKAKNMDVSVKILPLLKKDIQVRRLFAPELEINTGAGANSPVFRCGLDLNVSILINGMEFQKTEIPTTENRLKVIAKRFSCSLQQGDMLKTLSAKGNIKLTNAVLDNMNVLNVALDKLNMFSGLVRKLKDNLPEKYKPLMEKNSTEFKPINTGFEIRDERIFFEELLVESDAFYLLSKGSVGLDQSLQISSVLYIPQDLSAAFSNTVPELKYLEDTKGIITMPLEVTGRVPNIAVALDLNYVIQRLAVSKGQELLNKLFKAR